MAEQEKKSESPLDRIGRWCQHFVAIAAALGIVLTGLRYVVNQAQPFVWPLLPYAFVALVGLAPPIIIFLTDVIRPKYSVMDRPLAPMVFLVMALMFISIQSDLSANLRNRRDLIEISKRMADGPDRPEWQEFHRAVLSHFYYTDESQQGKWIVRFDGQVMGVLLYISGLLYANLTVFAITNRRQQTSV